MTKNAEKAPPTRRLGKDFYAKTALEAAPLLVGKLLCRSEDGVVVRRRICETECYMGETDSACHARAGKTARTGVMYREGGYAYVYLCYGIHYLLNVVTGAADVPQAVLIRGVEGAEGPGRVTRLMRIGKELNGEDLCASSALWLEDDGAAPKITAAKRIGIDYALEADREALWRFIAEK